MAGTINMADCDAGYACRALGEEQVICQGEFTFTAAGAISASSTDDPAMTLANDSGTGVHALTFPSCPAAWIHVAIQSASLTVTEALITAISATAGTATIKLSKAGTLAQAASGNKLFITVLGEVV